MKIVAGVDPSTEMANLVQLLRALRFSDPLLAAVHVIDRWTDQYEIPENRAVVDQVSGYMKRVEDDARNVLNYEVARFKDNGFASVEGILTSGFVANRLMDIADETDADLIAIGSTGKGTLESLLSGSVSRKVVIGSKKSVLISKGSLEITKHLTVVLATDHSRYADSFVRTFAEWAPQGISKIVVTTVFPEQIVKAINNVMPNFRADVGDWVRDHLEESNERTIKLLSPLAAECVGRVESGVVTDVLADVMKEEGAQLLVLGAQGHGFVERMSVGSVSLNQVVKAPYSVLVVRPSGDNIHAIR